MSKVLVIAASDSSVPTMQGAVDVLKEFSIDCEFTISSAHRSPQRSLELIEKFHKNGGKVIICGAGLAAHLAGVVAAHFPLPVIGVPLGDGPLGGQDALLATVQMPSGIPVATVGIDMSKNAGLLAVQILATSEKDLEEKLVEYKKKLADGVEEKAKKLEQNGSN
jgi:5-(carboxyamino)imidazole ribonucleotide mutase